MQTSEIKIEKKLNREISQLLQEPEIKLKFRSKTSTTYSDFLSNPMLVIYTIRKGVPYSLFNSIRDYTPFTEKDWSEFLDISTKSLQRYKQTDHQFKSIHSEKIIEISEVTHIGLDVFGTQDKFRLWLDTPNFALGNLTPLELLKDSYGKELVIGELNRINHGILA